jgi:hypothetical protein
LVVDPNGRPQFNTDENVSDGRSIQPDYTMAFLSTLTYKNFSLSFNFQTQNGGYFFSQTYAELTTPGKSLITAYNYRSPWIVPGSVLENADGTFSPNTSVFVTDPNQYWNNQGLEEFLLSASYIKLREMTLSYNLPMSILKSTPFRSIVVSAVGSNLFLWTPKENVYADPEQSLGFGIGQGSSVPGYEYAVIPSFRSYGFSLRATL